MTTLKWTGTEAESMGVGLKVQNLILFQFKNCNSLWNNNIGIENGITFHITQKEIDNLKAGEAITILCKYSILSCSLKYS